MQAISTTLQLNYSASMNPNSTITEAQNQAYLLCFLMPRTEVATNAVLVRHQDLSTKLAEL
jgi:hypothetical protein